ncbi:MAG TPA: amino acid permease [Terriglobales bacterium]|nr:amino acid permease [Terriglobales bacterium]
MAEIVVTGATRGAAPQLARDLKVSHASAIVVGTIIGSGIFLVPAEMMQAVGSSAYVYLAWIVGGLLSFFGALTYAELSAMKPEAGGEYVYVRDGYGPLGGFLYAWTYFLIAKPGSIATIVTGFVRILGTFAPLAFLPQVVIRNPVVITWGQLVAIGAIALISFINYIGVKRAGEFQLFFTLLKVAIIFGIVAAGFSYSRGSWTNFATTYPQAVGGFAGFMTALIAALWAYDGWNLVTTVSAEMRDPQRSLPISLIFGVATVAALYMLVNAAVQFVMPAGAIASSPRPASDAMARVAGPLGAGVVSAGMALSMLVTLNGSTLTGARIPFALARDGYFFRSIARIHPRFHTPSTSILVQALVACLLVLFAGNFQQLFSLTLFAEWLFYMLATASVFIFRVREPNANRPYKTWGYPLVPAVFILASAVLLYYSFMANWKNSIIGVIVILAGIPVFYRFSSKRASRES